MNNDLFKQLATQVITSVPKILGALFIFIIGYIIAKIVARTVKKLLVKVNVDKIGEKLNEVDLLQKSNFKIEISSVLSKIIYYVMMLLFLVASVDVLGMESLSNLVRDLINYIPQLLTAVVLLAVGLLIADTLSGIIKSTCASLGIPSAGIIGSMAFWIIFLTIGVSALSQAGIDTDFIRANISILLAGIIFAFAIGYGLASKSTVENFLASFYSKNKFALGDIIEIDGVKGEVVGMDNTSLTLTADNAQVIFPLSTLSKEKVKIYK